MYEYASTIGAISEFTYTPRTMTCFLLHNFDSSIEGRMRKNRSVRLIGGFLFLLLAALPGRAEERVSNLDAKVSDDGSIVAVVRYRSSGAEMRIARLDDEPIQWRRVDIPKLTQSFNFGNSNDEILITYGENQKDKSSTVHLAGVPLNVSNRPLKEYASSDVFLAFPVQISDGSILVLSGLYRAESGQVPEKIWKIIRQGIPPETIGQAFPRYGGYPTVIGTGFYAIEPVYSPVGGPPKLHRWALPGGALPDVAHQLTSNTNSLKCTRQGDFCLRGHTYLENFQYLGRVVVLANGKECPLSDLPKRIDRIDVAENARVAAIVVARDAHAPRRVRVLKFANDSCQLIKNIQVEG